MHKSLFNSENSYKRLSESLSFKLNSISLKKVDVNKGGGGQKLTKVDKGGGGVKNARFWLTSIKYVP